MENSARILTRQTGIIGDKIFAGFIEITTFPVEFQHFSTEQANGPP